MEKEVVVGVCSFIIGAFTAWSLMNNKVANTEKQKIRLETQLESFSNTQVFFQKIAQEIIQQSQDKIAHNHLNLLEPFRDELKEFKQKVENLQHSGIENTSLIKEKIDTLTKNSTQLCFQAEELTNTLKVNAKGRGIFGELVLEQILNSAGLINKKTDSQNGNYITQKGFSEKEILSKNNNYPDVVVFFPDENKQIIIDSKCPLNDFQAFINEADENKKANHLKNFYNAVWNMVENLSEKYNNLEGLNLPDFKLLFLPIESAYLYVFENQDLILKATEKNILIVGPSSLLAILKIIKQSWDTRRLSNNMQDIKNHALKLYDKFCIFLEKMEKINTRFSSLNNDFQGLFTTIQGQDGLISRFEKLKMLGINPSKQINKKLIDTDFVEENSFCD